MPKTGCFVPEDCCLALVCDPNRLDLRTRGELSRNALQAAAHEKKTLDTLGTPGDSLKDELGILFDPAEEQ